MPQNPTNPSADNAYRRFAAYALLSRLDHLWKEAEGVRAGEDIEYIHKMRVASRRLRTALDVMSPVLPERSLPRWIKGVRRITRALGAARDTDVEIIFLEDFLAAHTEPVFRPGLARLLLRLQQRRHELQKKVLTALDDFENGVLSEMQRGIRALELDAESDGKIDTSLLLLRHAYAQIALRVEGLLAFDAAAGEPDRKQEHHAMRIAAKHLRYTMETFSPLYADELKLFIDPVKVIQDLLGALHDCDVWVEKLPGFLDEERLRTEQFFGSNRSFHHLLPGIQFLENDRSQEGARQYRDFYRYWMDMKKQSLWRHLQRTIKSPLRSTGVNHAGKK
jgi:CHAD domain-containing protein